MMAQAAQGLELAPPWDANAAPATIKQVTRFGSHLFKIPAPNLSRGLFFKWKEKIPSLIGRYKVFHQALL